MAKTTHKRNSPTHGLSADDMRAIRGVTFNPDNRANENDLYARFVAFSKELVRTDGADTLADAMAWVIGNFEQVAHSVTAKCWGPDEGAKHLCGKGGEYCAYLARAKGKVE